MPDLFDFFRYVLGTVVTVYATVITLQSLWSWYVWLAGRDKYVSMMRRYLLVHGLRLRVVRFGGDLLVSGLLCVAFGILWYAHAQTQRLADAMQSARQVKVHVSRISPISDHLSQAPARH